jgi:hypothetical protein
MLVLLGIAVLVLAAAVAALFAMLGELASRTPSSGEPATVMRPLDVELGVSAGAWPESLPSAQDAVLLVLSTACGSCADVARQLSVEPGHADWRQVGVVVSCSAAETGTEFVAEHGLRHFAHFVDPEGAWARGEFGVQSSPSALVFRGGRLASAWTFTDVTTLRSTVDAQQRGYERKESV